MDYTYENLIPTIQYFVERKDTPSWSIGESVILYNDLTYIINGEATYIINGEKVILKQGDLIYIPKGSTRKAYTNPVNPIHCYAFNFDYEFIDGVHVDLPFWGKFNIQYDSELLALFRQFNNLWLEKESGYILKARGMFMIILHMLIKLQVVYKPLQYSDYKIEKVKSYILEHFTDKIYIGDLAELVKLHPAYLSTRFRNVTGYTIKGFTNNIRINKAYDLLSTNGYSVTDTAIICGFDDIFYFSKLFKKITGHTPSEILNK